MKQLLFFPKTKTTYTLSRDIIKNRRRRRWITEEICGMDNWLKNQQQSAKDRSCIDMWNSFLFGVFHCKEMVMEQNKPFLDVLVPVISFEWQRSFWKGIAKKEMGWFSVLALVCLWGVYFLLRISLLLYSCFNEWRAFLLSTHSINKNDENVF